jgi:hypothetical protein
VTVSRGGKSGFDCLGLDTLLLAQPGLAVRPRVGHELVITGEFSFRARWRGVEVSDTYSIEIAVPASFPPDLPAVKEVGGRIPPDFHRYRDGTLCLGSPIRLSLTLGRSPDLSRFLECCLVPYLYGYSYKEQHGKLPFGELQHGGVGIVQDLQRLLGVSEQSTCIELLHLTSMARRLANRRPCPCGSGRRVGRCHHRVLNRLRAHFGRSWCRGLKASLLGGSLHDKRCNLVLRRI